MCEQGNHLRGLCAYGAAVGVQHVQVHAAAVRLHRRARPLHIIYTLYTHVTGVTSGFEMCFAMLIGSRHTFGTFGAGGPNQNTSRIQIL